MLIDVLAYVKYFGGYRLRVGEDWHSLHLVVEDSDERRGRQTLPLQQSALGYVIVVGSASAVPSNLCATLLFSYLTPTPLCPKNEYASFNFYNRVFLLVSAAWFLRQ